ncbi:MAG: SUMF1/EgtB/PvdO family nonheme iron enzyme [Planctomycetota bacterium]|nr:SUMF1/EgtB/PvdO family nonheme iron enzyme [Planctomycetota bacterium]
MARTALLFVLLCLTPLFAHTDEPSGSIVTLSATEDGVTLYVDAEKLGTTPHVTILQPGSHKVEFVVSSQLRIERELDIGDEDRVLVFAHVEDEEITVLTDEVKITEFLSKFSRQVEFRRYFDAAMQYYRDKQLRKAVRTLEKAISCCETRQARDLLVKWRTELLPDGFVYIPGGAFVMGDPEAKDDALDGPAHEVIVSDFAISRYEVTNEQFEQFVRATKYATTAELKGAAPVWDADKKEWVEVEGANWRYPKGRRVKLESRLPVCQISWHDAMSYCEWLSNSLGLAQDTISLPYEAQWEYAARSGADQKYPWGSVSPFGDVKLAVVNTSEPMPVGSYPDGASQHGVFDLIGNVWEWCRDSASEQYYTQCRNEQPVTDPTGAQVSARKVVRGGGFASTEDSADSRSSRLFSTPIPRPVTLVSESFTISLFARNPSRAFPSSFHIKKAGFTPGFSFSVTWRVTLVRMALASPCAVRRASAVASRASPGRCRISPCCPLACGWSGLWFAVRQLCRPYRPELPPTFPGRRQWRILRAYRFCRPL